MEDANFHGIETERVQVLAREIILQKASLDFMTVAKAMCLLAEIRGRSHSVELGNCLGISRQTRRNWLILKLPEWVDLWERRICALKEKSPAPKKTTTRITEKEWLWIAKTLAQCGQKSWQYQRDVIYMAAGREAEYSHLRNIAKSTLWSNRSKLRRLRDQLQADSDVVVRNEDSTYSGPIHSG